MFGDLAHSIGIAGGLCALGSARKNFDVSKSSIVEAVGSSEDVRPVNNGTTTEVCIVNMYASLGIKVNI
jgi:hypothetical protein